MSMSTQFLARKLGMIIHSWRLLGSRLYQCEARLKGVRFEGRVIFQGRPIVSVAAGSALVLEEGVAVASSPRCGPLGCFQPSVLRTLAAGAELILHRNVGLSATVLCAARLIEIGEGTILGAGAMVFDTDFHHPEGEWGWNNDFARGARPIRIGRGCFIGARALVLKGVTIGDRAVVGAGAVVAHDVPAGQIAVGNPARNFSRRDTPASGPTAS